MNLEDVGQIPCPGCGVKALAIEWRLETKPLGTYSLAGQQLKVSANEVPWVVCSSCGVEAKGKR